MLEPLCPGLMTSECRSKRLGKAQVVYQADFRDVSGSDRISGYGVYPHQVCWGTLPLFTLKTSKKKQTHTWVQEAPLDRFSVLYCFIVYMFRS